MSDKKIKQQSKFGKPLGFQPTVGSNMKQSQKPTSTKGVFNPTTFKQTQHKG